MLRKSTLCLSLVGFIALLSLLVTGVFAAPDSQAEPVEPTAQQQTLEASVNDLFRQTAEAQQPNYTETVQAMFEAALTATAATATPTAYVTPEPLDVSGLEVVDTTEIDLVAGPMRTSAYLAPHGETFAWFNQAEDGIEICIYTIAGENTGCTVTAARNYEFGSVRWSPDSTRLVFAQDFLRLLIDSDIWVFDTETMTASNITDDGTDDLDFFSDSEDAEKPPIDLMPLWDSDSQGVYFMRYDINDEAGRNRPDLYRIDSASGDMELIRSFAMSLPIAIYRGAISPDGRWLAYNVDVEVGRTVNIRLLDLETKRDRLLTPFVTGDNRQFYVEYLQFSPDSRYLLVRDPSELRMGFTINIEYPVSRVFDLEGNEIVIDPEQQVTDAGWLATGAGLVYQVRGADDPTQGAMYITGKPGEPGRQIIDGLYYGINTYGDRVDWGANNVLLRTERGGSPIIVFQLAAE